MTSRERVIAAIEFSGPDRIPHRHAFLPAVFDRYGDRVKKLLRRFPSDFAGDEGVRPDGSAFRTGQFTDQWGCVWTVPRPGFGGQVTVHPLSDWKALKTYQWPDPERMDLRGQRRLAQRRGDKYLALGVGTVFQRMIALRGFENLMTDIAKGAPELLTLRDRIVGFNLKLTERLLELDPDSLEFADDWGSQHSLLIRPSVWRELFLPAYRTLFARVREAGRHVFFHSDGCTIDILPDLVEAGAQQFWVDLTVNGLSALQERLGGRVCFQAMPDVQFTLRYGTPEDVRAHAKDMIAALSTFDGGFIACCELAPDQPWENIVAILETFHDYGSYPLRLTWAGDHAVEI
ncbi:MAG TPA: hypothetical protein EYP53_05365 [Candidatus Latescibacteria bacterium]|nr:hypothetical protein [Candidatus Latescibacterota bacterium]